MSLDAINAQIAAARAAAATGAAQAAPPVPMTDPTQGQGYAQPPALGQGYQAPAVPQGGRPVALGELLAQGGMRVDAYVTPKLAGIVVDKDEVNPVEELAVEFKLSDVVPYWGLRWGSNPTKYLKSFDRILESRSKKPWAQCVAEAQASDQKCRGDYPTVDIPFRYVGEEVMKAKGGDKGKVLLKNGQTIGWTSSITNFNEFAAFIKPYDDLRQAGQIPNDLVLRGRIVHKSAEGGGNTYGKIDFVDFVAVGIEAGE